MSGNRRASSNGAAPGRLSFGEDGVSRERVIEIQRARMLTAMAEVAAERGVGSVTVAQIVERAGVSRRTFYEIFDDCEDCFLAAFDWAAASAYERILDASPRQAGWTVRIRASLTALLGFLDDEPAVGRMLVVESLGAGARALERRRRVLAEIAAVVDEGRTVGKAGTGATQLTAEGITGAVLSVIHGRMPQSDAGPLIELVNPLMNMIVLPYLGTAAARRELEFPAVKALCGPAVARNPLRDLEMRLTYRTVRVLTVVGVNPGSSNRVVGDASGIADQGQVSKLLTRLSKLGLVENTGVGSARGEPNAWMLTERGEEVHSALTGHTAPA